MIYLNCMLLLGIAPLVLAGAAPRSEELPEAKLLKQLPAVKREGLNLIIKTPRGAVVFTDKPNETEQYLVNELLAFFRLSETRTDYLVGHGGWESWSVSIVNGAHGTTIALPAEPALSPDKRRYFSSSIDLDAGYAPNVLTIIRAIDFKVEASFDFNTPEHPGGPLEVKWITPTEISVVTATRQQDGKYLRAPPKRIKFEGGKWIGLQAIKQ